MARATTSTNVFVSWAAVADAASYQIFRSSTGTTFSQIATSSNNFYNDSTAVPATSYLYRVRAVDGSSNVSSDSNYDLATTVIFTDASLSAGVTQVKAVHITQLRTAVNAVRALAFLTPAMFADPLTAGTSTILRTHVTDLRSALNEARSTLALPPLTYSDSTITAGVTPIRAEHITQLRGGVNGAMRPGSACDPGTGSCSGNVGTYCSPDGMSFLTETCDPDQATTCNGQTGRCEGACAPVSLASFGTSPVGCDFYPTVTANIVSSSFNFAVAVSNANASAATVTVTRGASVVNSITVAGNSVQVIALPWIASLKGPDDAAGAGVAFPASILVSQGAYRLRTTLPVTIYQYSPLQYVLGVTFSYSNDASLLFPVHIWGTQYRVAAQYHFANYSGFYAVTAHNDNTVVTASNPSASLIKVGSGLPASGSGMVTLNAGDVLEIVTASGSPANDVTGTHISASKPVQVIGGHQCVFVPVATGFCDHLEESLRPLSSLSTSYVVIAPLIPTTGMAKVRRIRLVGTQDSTALTYDPPQAGLPSTLNAGGWFETLNTAASFRITSSKPILVTEYMTGQNAGGNAGDPAMTVATGIDQYRTSYTFFAPTNYTSNYINIVAPTGTTVTLDGVALVSTDFTAIGTSGYSEARKALSNSGNGQHVITASAPIGISVYGYGQYTSYWY